MQCRRCTGRWECDRSPSTNGSRIEKEKQERAHDQAQFQGRFESVVAQAMQAEGLCEKATAVAAHVADQVKLYERHSEEQERKADLFKAQANHLVQRYEEQCNVLRSERDAKQLEFDNAKHQCILLEQSSTNALQERIQTLNKTVS